MAADRGNRIPQEPRELELENAALKVEIGRLKKKAGDAFIESRKAEQTALNAKEQVESDRKRLQTIIETIPSAVVVVEGCDGRFSYLNKRATDLYGFKYSGLRLAEHAAKVKAFKPDGVPCTHENIPVGRSLRSGEEVRNEELIIERGDGERVPVMVSSAPLFDASGKVTAAVVVFEEIAERRRAEEEQKRLLQEIDEQRGRLQAIIDSLPVGLWIADAQGKVVFVNDIGRAIWGGDTPDAIGQERHGPYKAWWADTGELIGVEEMPLARAIRGETCKDRAVEFERLDGTRGVKLISAAPVKGSDGTIIGSVAIVQDITERKRAEDALKASREQLRQQAEKVETIMKAAPAAIWVSLDPQCRAITGNRAAISLYEAFEEENDPRVSCPRRYFRNGKELKPEELPMLEAAAKNVDINNSEFDVLLPSGKVRHMMGSASPLHDAEGKVSGCVGTFLDITDRKQAEEAVRDELERLVQERTADLEAQTQRAEEERDRLMTLIDSMGEAVWVSDANGQIVLVNAVARSQAVQIGLDPNNLMQIPPLQTEMFGADGKRLNRELAEIASQKGALHGLELAITNRKTGETFHRRLAVSPIVDKDKRFEGHVAIVEDITAQKKAEEQKVRLEEQLRQAQKMESIGTLAGGIAHDFNNMLAVILGNAELALDDLRDGAGAARNIEQIVNASKRAGDLVRQILTFSRRTEHRKDALILTPLVKETHKLLRSTLPSTIRMELRLRTKHDAVAGDPSQLQQVLMNLAGNAAYAMRERGGTLSITLSDVAFTPLGRRPAPDMEPGRYVKIAVKDTGAGMTPDVREKIFEPFFTTKEVGQGTGMGLAVVYGIVKSHGGAIFVQSKPGKGSTFTVFLPFAGTTAREERGTTRAAPRGSERILLVDDEPQIVATVSETLRRLGYDVTTAASGNEALKTFLDRPQYFDLIVTDQTMPDLAGIDLARRMLEARGNLPIILITGYSEAVSPEKAKSAGITEFVMKPIGKREMAEAVRRALNRIREDVGDGR